MWTAVPVCSQKSPLLLQCHLWFRALWQRPLSQARRVSWVRLAWNSSVPDGRFQRPRGRREANDDTWFSLLYFINADHTNDRVKVFCSKQDSIAWKMTLLQHRNDLGILLFCPWDIWDTKWYCRHWVKIIRSVLRKERSIINLYCIYHWVMGRGPITI